MTLTSTAPDQVISDLEWWLGRKWPMTRAEACAQAAEIGWKLDDGQLVTDYDVQDLIKDRFSDYATRWCCPPVLAGTVFEVAIVRWRRQSGDWPSVLGHRCWAIG